MEIEEARKAYKLEFGKLPHHRAALKTILERLPDKAQASEKITPLNSHEPVATSEIIKEGPEIKTGNRQVKEYEVWHKGKKKMWTINTIKSWSTTPENREQIEFPENSDFEGWAEFKNCQRC